MAKKKATKTPRPNHPGPRTTCPDCGHKYQYKMRVCPKCGSENLLLLLKEQKAAIENVNLLAQVDEIIELLGGKEGILEWCDRIEQVKKTFGGKK